MSKAGVQGVTGSCDYGIESGNDGSRIGNGSQGRGTLGLYIHIPFCVRKCNYCDFLSFPAGSTDGRDHRPYIGALVREMEMWKERVSACEVDTIFIGGGTPSILSTADMGVVLDAIHKNFRTGELAEFTIECNPGSVSDDKLRLYRGAGVDRISLGMQSAVDDELRRLGRVHGYREFLESYHMVREHGFRNVNVDIMSAIPGQTLESYERTLGCVMALEPEHISSYSLIIEEGTPFYERYADHPPVDEDTDRKMYERTGELLAGAGYERYEISNYASVKYEGNYDASVKYEGNYGQCECPIRIQKSPPRSFSPRPAGLSSHSIVCGDRVLHACRHNMKYWRRGEYLGVGLGAASFLGHTRFSNERDMRAYHGRIDKGELPVAETEELSPDQEKFEFVYLGLRCMEGISSHEFRACFGEDIGEYFGEAIRWCRDQGLLVQEGGRIFLSKKGIDVSNRVFEAFVPAKAK